MRNASAIQLDGSSLTIEELVRVARDPSATIVCSPSAMQRVEAAAALVRGIVERYEKSIRDEDPNPIMDYGITTGFGEFKRVPIDPKRLARLQANILLSHAAGVGETLDEEDLSNYYPAEVIRAVLVIRINTFLKGHSGVRPRVVNVLVEMVNRRVIPLVPLRGSVGSSGDLAPLAHLFITLCEEGRKSSRFYQLGTGGQLGIHDLKPTALQESTHLPKLLGVEPIEPSHKEGLALTNGATFSAAMLALAVHDATSLAISADVAAAMSAEALLGCARAFDAKVHEARQQTGQIASAACLRTLLNQSELLETASEVQDPYSIRAAPAVHGASRDALEFARKIVSRELNAATDNPLFFGDAESWDLRFAENWSRRREKRLPVPERAAEPEYHGNQRRSYSAANFHGQPIGMAADFLAIALAEFANISERRTQLLMDRNHNRGLPANLVADAGLNSGFMIAQYCAAGLVSENKVLAHPASVDSIPTSSNSEDHNAMATIAARKLRTVLANVRHTLGIELLAAAQALEWATLFDELNTRTLAPAYARLGRDYLESLRSEADPKQPRKPRSEQERRQERWQRGDIERRLFAAWTEPENRERIRARLGNGTGQAYLAIRKSIAPLIQDRVLADDIRLAARLLAPGPEAKSALVKAVEAAKTRKRGKPKS